MSNKKPIILSFKANKIDFMIANIQDYIPRNKRELCILDTRLLHYANCIPWLEERLGFMYELFIDPRFFTFWEPSHTEKLIRLLEDIKKEGFSSLYPILNLPRDFRPADPKFKLEIKIRPRRRHSF